MQKKSNQDQRLTFSQGSWVDEHPHHALSRGVLKSMKRQDEIKELFRALEAEYDQLSIDIKVQASHIDKRMNTK